MEKVDVKEILRNVLEEEGIPSSYYSLEGYSEEAVCLEMTSKSCNVYYGERNNRYNEEVFKTLTDACNGIIERLSDSNVEAIKLKNKFYVAILQKV